MNIDFAPTMLDMAGVEIPAAMQGKSLMPLIEKEKIKWRESIFAENNFTSHFMPALNDAGDQRGKVLERSIRSKSIRTERYKYVRYFEQRPMIEELFDIRNDPIEVSNLAEKSEYSDILASLRKLCDDWIRQAQ
jgi:arylsulfatase A-like enzyme